MATTQHKHERWQSISVNDASAVVNGIRQLLAQHLEPRVRRKVKL